MDPALKKQLSNEKRLKAIAEWKKKDQQKVVFKGSRVIFDDIPEQKKSYTLFDSDNEEEDQTDWNFNIRPQFEGPKGKELLELNAQLPERFKLDERFKDDDNSIVESNEENDEKAKSLKILESVLGVGVNQKYSSVNEPRKLGLRRFDPDDENCAKFLKTQNEPSHKPKKRPKKESPKEEAEIPISSERFIEVSDNLKDILSSSGPATFSHRFTANDGQEISSLVDENPFLNAKPSNDSSSFGGRQKKKSGVAELSIEKPPLTSNLKYFFFISGDDERLKEGVEFFHRPKPMDKIREEWNQSKEEVKKLFKLKKKYHMRRPICKKKIGQRKNMLRKK